MVWKLIEEINEKLDRIEGHIDSINSIGWREKWVEWKEIFERSTKH